jgi:hypothetical protein
MPHACFYTICLVFRYTSWHFYAFSGTNLLTRCHSASSLFSAVFVFQKSYTENILGIGQNKSQTYRYLPKLSENQRGDREEPLVGHTTRGRGLGLARAPYGEPHQVHFWRRPFAYKDPPDGKNLKTQSLFQNTSRSTVTAVDPRSGGSRSSSRHPAREGNRHRRSSSSPCLPPARWVCSLPWTMGS